MGGSSVKEGSELLLKAGIPCFLDPARAIWALGILRREAKIRER
jgi:acyl-CoA synthetase (NDP forming)